MEYTSRLIPVLDYFMGTILPASYLVRAFTGAPPDEFGENFGTAATWRLVGPGPALVVFAHDLPWPPPASSPPSLQVYRWPCTNGERPGLVTSASPSASSWPCTTTSLSRSSLPSSSSVSCSSSASFSGVGGGNPFPDPGDLTCNISPFAAS